MSELNPKDDAGLDLPEGLRRALGDLHKPTSGVPSRIDHAILTRARVEHRGRRRMWIGTRWAAIAMAAAAVVSIAIRLFAPVGGNEKPQLARLGDVNHDSKINILDAYVVARHIARHESLDKAWDINGDGVVDSKDVDLIASMAVSTSEPQSRATGEQGQ